MSEYGSPDATVADDVVREMVAACRPSWTVDGIDRVEEGTDFVAVLDVDAARPDASAPADATAAPADAGATTPERAVLKATTSGFVEPAVARSEPRFFEFLAAETDIPVPDVYGYRDDHEELPAPFYVVEYVPGENYEDSTRPLSEDAIRRALRAAGENLAELHELGPLPAVGRIGVRDGDLAVLDTDDAPRFDDAREQVRGEFADVIDALADGTWFPERADEPARFADLVPELREYAAATVPALPEPEQPTYCHWDYRWGNVLLDPETGATQAVLDMAKLASIEPAYNLATVESHMLDADDPDPETLDARRDVLRDAYVGARTDDWTFTPEIRERVACYRLLSEIVAMACLPLWHEDATAEERDAIAADHREFVRERL